MGRRPWWTHDEDRNMNEKAPHRAVVNVMAEVYETLPNGQATGRPDKKDSRLVVLDGKDKAEVDLKLSKLMEQLDEAIANSTRESTSEG